MEIGVVGQGLRGLSLGLVYVKKRDKMAEEGYIPILNPKAEPRGGEWTASAEDWKESSSSTQLRPKEISSSASPLCSISFKNSLPHSSPFLPFPTSTTTHTTWWGDSKHSASSLYWTKYETQTTYSQSSNIIVTIYVLHPMNPPSPINLHLSYATLHPNPKYFHGGENGIKDVDCHHSPFTGIQLGSGSTETLSLLQNPSIYFG